MQHRGTQTITTERLVLRRFRLDDAALMFYNWANDAEVTRYLTWQPHGDISVTTGVLRSWVNDYRRPDFYQWAIEYEGTLIGAIGAHEPNENLKSIAVGYCMGRSWWGRGIMTEALKAVIGYLFSIGANRIWAIHHVNNPASGRVMEKSGMQYEGIIRQGGKNNIGVLHDVRQYAIVASDLANRQIN